MSTAHTFADWLKTTQGHYLLEREQKFIDHSVADVFGFHAMQMGLPQYDLLRESRIPLRVVAGAERGSRLLMEIDKLPFATDSLDLALLPHVLEFNGRPHEILREIQRVVLPGGHVIITGFNPLSLWGLRRALGPKHDYPWRGKFISLLRMKDWLALLGFEVVTGRFSCYAPPLSNPAWLNRMGFMEPAGNRWWAVCGGAYFLKAVKRVPGMRLIKPQWNGNPVEKLLPVRPKLHDGMSQQTRADAQ